MTPRMGLSLLAAVMLSLHGLLVTLAQNPFYNCTMLLQTSMKFLAIQMSTCYVHFLMAATQASQWTLTLLCQPFLNPPLLICLDRSIDHYADDNYEDTPEDEIDVAMDNILYEPPTSADLQEAVGEEWIEFEGNKFHKASLLWIIFCFDFS